MALTERQRRFAAKAVSRKEIFLRLSLIGVAIGGGLLVFWLWRWWTEDDFALGLRFVLVVLILLNARQNLRQWRYAGVLEALGVETDPGLGDGSSGREDA